MRRRTLSILLLPLAVVLLLPEGARASDSDPWLSRDKALHFDATAGIAAATYAVSAGWLFRARWQAMAASGGIAFGVGVGKEVIDATGLLGGDPSWKDLAWDAFGTVAGLVLAWGVDLLLGGVSAQRPAFASPLQPDAGNGWALRF